MKATVTVHYTMFFENQDEPFDSSELRGRAERYKVGRLRLQPRNPTEIIIISSLRISCLKCETIRLILTKLLLPLQLDDGRFIPGFEAAVKSMEKDEEAEFLIAPEVGGFISSNYSELKKI